MRQLARDPCAAKVPLEAYKSPESMFITLCGLRLPTAAHVHNATGIIRDCVASLDSDFRSAANPPTNAGSKGPVAPLILRLSGLQNAKSTSLGRDQSEVTSMGAIADDSTMRTKNFFERTKQELNAAGLGELSYHPIQYAGHVNFFATDRIYGDKLQKGTSPKQTLLYARIGRKAELTFDAREMHDKFKDHVWIDNLELEKVSICETGRKDMIQEGRIIGQGYREVASIPLPGVRTASQVQLPHEQGITFSKPPNKIRRVPLYLEDIDRERRASHSD